MSKKLKEGLRMISHQTEKINEDTEIINRVKLKFWSWQLKWKKKKGEFSSSKESATEDMRLSSLRKMNSTWDLWDTIDHVNICTRRDQEGKKRETKGNSEGILKKWYKSS